VVSSGFLIRPERFSITIRSMARPRRVFLARDEPAASAQGAQRTDVAAVAGDSKGLPVPDRIHDLPTPQLQVALRDLRVPHIFTVTPVLPSAAVGGERLCRAGGRLVAAVTGDGYGRPA
jgi:hypothetical protein